mmetsp:Transcript_31600/g.50996  ORF Transcript_31600/g.50996 Transcript_31600/m.50996 type:complete len:103 (+) Transcript_31600:376-684(+)
MCCFYGLLKPCPSNPPTESQPLDVDVGQAAWCYPSVKPSPARGHRDEKDANNDLFDMDPHGFLKVLAGASVKPLDVEKGRKVVGGCWGIRTLHTFFQIAAQE